MLNVGQQIRSTSSGAMPEQTQAGFLNHGHLLAGLARVLHFQILVAKQGHMPLLQPFEKSRSLLAQFKIDTGTGANLLLCLLQPLTHGGKIIHHQRDLLQYLNQCLPQLLQFGRV